jgi:hypothetical protein
MTGKTTLSTVSEEGGSAAALFGAEHVFLIHRCLMIALCNVSHVETYILKLYGSFLKQVILRF